MSAGRRGRPRSEASHRAVMEAVARLLDEQGCAYEAVTVEGIAAEAGVGKQTIYRWWQNKAAVVLEALLTGYLKLDFAPVADTGDLKADLHAWLEEGHRSEEGTDDGVTMTRSLMAALVTSDPEMQELVREADPWANSHLAARFRAAAEAGHLREGTDPSLLTSAVMGPVVMQMVTAGKPDPEWAGRLVDMLLEGALRR
ncbi:TetR/AcrR family transcriptional regulator [Nesterenkonia populi]|uniref:TetR/AcrR family transcriptional regulator n=1 Tax=Nesterenkonia populi TaxID=1591087 RepID=UPI0011BD44A6|nr:TetR/AcrR family transcriptional regulator [Nesterenkonia populi]